MEKQKISISFKIYFVICTIIVLVCSIIQKNSILVIVATVCEIIYMLFNARFLKYSFLFGIANALIYGIVFITQKMYGSACYNLLYMLPMMLYGYFKLSKDKEFKINSLDKNVGLYMSSIFFALVIGVSIILKMFGGNLVVLDSISLIGGIFVVFLFSNRYIEQWPVFVLINISYVIMWSIFTFQNIVNLPVLIMYIIYSVNSIYGMIVWYKTLRKY